MIAVWKYYGEKIEEEFKIGQFIPIDRSLQIINAGRRLEGQSELNPLVCKGTSKECGRLDKAKMDRIIGEAKARHLKLNGYNLVREGEGHRIKETDQVPSLVANRLKMNMNQVTNTFKAIEYIDITTLTPAQVDTYLELIPKLMEDKADILFGITSAVQRLSELHPNGEFTTENKE